MMRGLILAVLGVLTAAMPVWGQTAQPMSFEQLAALRSVREVRISPGGEQVAYVLEVPRRPGMDDDGPAWRELWVVGTGGQSPARAYIRKKNVSRLRFSRDGQRLHYLAKRDDDEKTSLWSVRLDGGESDRLLTFDSAILDYELSPDGSEVIFIATEPESDQQEEARDKGYKQEVFEEDWRPRRAWRASLDDPDAPPVNPATLLAEEAEEADKEDEGDEEDGPRPLDIDGSVFGIDRSRDGSVLALEVAPRPLVDDRYMFRRVHLVAADSGKTLAVLDNPGKLGPVALSPDGKQVAMISAADPNDPREGRLMVAPTSGGELRDLLPELEGHVSRIAWQDAGTLMYLADVGVETVLGEVDTETAQTKEHLRSAPGSLPVMTDLHLTADGQRAALIGEEPSHPAEVYVVAHGDDTPRRLTDSNPWLAEVALATQQAISHQSRDGLELQGILLRPLSDPGEQGAPLILIVHGGPEGHVRNGWVSNYSRPGQLAAGKGYAVFYPNYRGSTGRGVTFSKLGQGDAAGREFDDLIDAVDHLVQAGIADRERVGITGGSYGGYATAWCSTRFTERFKAGVMFVGISNKVSKALTTEIPVEDMMVHTLFDPWTNWEFSLERSPIYHAEQSRTALLIAVGTEDPRVHPSQSLQLYRVLKLIGKTPVRLVRYPGEKHGNSKAAARDDYARRLMRWMDHYLLGTDRSLPPWQLDGPQE